MTGESRELSKFCLKFVLKPFPYIKTIENYHVKLRTPTSEFTVYYNTLPSLQSTVSRPLHPPLGALKINSIWQLRYNFKQLYLLFCILKLQSQQDF